MDRFVCNSQVTACMLLTPVLAFLSCRLICIAKPTGIAKEEAASRFHDRADQNRSLSDLGLTRNVNFSLYNQLSLNTFVTMPRVIGQQPRA